MALREILANFKVNFDAKALRLGSAQVDRAKRSLVGLTGTTGAASAGAARTAGAVGTIGVSAQRSATGVAALKGQLASMSAGIGKVHALGAAFAAAFAVGIVKDFFGEILKGADAVGKTSTALGLATDKVQAYQAFVQQAGGTTEDFEKSFKRVAKAASDAVRSGASPAAEGFKKLGVEVKNADGSLRSTEDLFLEVGGALGTMANKTDALSISQDLLGRGATKILPGFANGTAAAKEQIKTLTELAVVYDEQMIRESEKLNDEMLVTGLQFKRIAVQLVRAFIPILRATNAVLTPVMNGFAAMLKNTNALQIGLSLLAGKGFAMVLTKIGAIVKIFGGWRAAIARLLPFVAKFLLPFLVLDDIVTTLQGGDSIIRRILDTLLGADKAKAIISGINDVIDGTIAGIKSMFQFMAAGFADEDGSITAGFLQTTQKMGEAMDSFFDSTESTFKQLIKDIGFLMGATWETAMSDAVDSSAANAPITAAEFVEAWELLKKDFGEIWDSIWESASATFQGVVDGIVGIWDRAIASMKAGIGSLIGGAVEVINKLPGVNIDLGSTGVGSANTVGGSTRNVTINDNTQVSQSINAPTAQAAVAAGVAQARAVNLPKRRLATLNAVRQ